MASTSLGRLYVDLLMKTGSFETDAGRAAKIAEKRAKEIDKAFAAAVGNTTANLQKMGAGLLGVFSGIAAGSKLVSVQREFDVLNAQLITATGSMGGASTAFENLQKFAAKTPFALQQSVEAFVKLTNLGLTPSERALTSYGNTASAMGKDLSQLIEAVADATTGEFERLKEFGIKAKQQGDKVSLTFKGSTTTIGKSAQEIEAYLIGLGEVEFDGAMARRMDSLDGKLSNLGDSFDLLFLTVSQSGLGDAFSDGAEAAAAAIADLTAEIEAGEYDAFFASISDITGALSRMGGEAGLLSGSISIVANLVTAAVDVFTVLGTAVGATAAQLNGMYNAAAGVISLDWGRIREGIGLAAEGNAAARNALLFGTDNSGKSLLRLGNEDPFRNVVNTEYSSYEAKPARAMGRSAPAGSKKKAGKSDAEKEAEQLAKALQALSEKQDERLAKLQAELDLGNKIGEAWQVAYDIQNGELKKLEPAEKLRLLIGAETNEQLQIQIDLRDDLKKKADEQAKNFKRVTDDLAAEAAAYSMTNMELRTRNALKEAGVKLDTAQGQAIAALVQQADKAERLADVMDNARGIAYDFLIDLPNGAADAWKNALASIESMLLQWAAKGIIEQVFGQSGTTGSGSMFGDMLGGLFSGGAGGEAGGFNWGGIFSSLFGGGRADGGPVMGGKMYEVNERGMPELLSVGSKQLLMMPAGQGGRVTPMRTGGNSSTTYKFYLAAPAEHRTQEQIFSKAEYAQKRAAARNN